MEKLTKIIDHIPHQDYQSMISLLSKRNLYYCKQIHNVSPPRKFENLFRILRAVPIEKTVITPAQPQKQRQLQYNQNTIDIYTDASIKNQYQYQRKAGIGIVIPSQQREISMNAPSATNPTQAELQAIVQAIDLCKAGQSVNIHTDSSQAIKLLEKTSESTRRAIRQPYCVEIDRIKKEIRRKRLTVSYTKEHAHQGHIHNERADTLAKNGTNIKSEFHLKPTIAILTDQNHQAISQDPRKWLNKHEQTINLIKWQTEHLPKYISIETIESTQWQATKMVWDQEGAIKQPNTSIEGTRARTFQFKVLHNRLPTASRKALFDPSYPTNGCLHCTHEETTNHILTCNHTKIKLDVILNNLIAQIQDFNTLTNIGQTFFHQDQENQTNLIRGLVPKAWIPSNHTKKTLEQAATLVNIIIKAFRKLIWNPWCTARKQWEKLNQPHIRRPENNPTHTIYNRPYTKDIYIAIMYELVEYPTLVLQTTRPHNYISAV
jgi:ribonuclease HI